MLLAIHATHGHRSCAHWTAKSFKGRLETALLALAWIGFLLPVAWLASPLLAWAEYPPLQLPFARGCAWLALGPWFLHRSHADLGTDGSVSLELPEDHTPVDQGVYTRVRHPMQLALCQRSIGQALVLAKWIAGPASIVNFGVLFILRIGVEERMVQERLYAEYEAHMARTKRLLPGLW